MQAILDQNTRIVGGLATTIEQFPWIVSMQRFGAHRCGASIITHNRLVSAAHCTFALAASSLQIRAGSTHSQSGGQFEQVSDVINHPQYNFITLNNDICVMWLERSLTLGGPTAAPIRLPEQGAGVATGAMAQVAGWGSMVEGGPGSPGLRYVSVPIVTNAQCSQSYGPGITAGMLCAGFPEGGRDACQGDSGGPLTLGASLIGVVSWGAGCARPGFPGVYARVAHFRNWVDSVM